MGYSGTSKAFHIYILGQRHVEVSRDVTFDEEVSFKRSRESYLEIDSEEQEAPKDADFSSLAIHPLDDQR